MSKECQILIKQTCFYKVKASADVTKDRVLESINSHPVELNKNAELYDINTEVINIKGE